MKTGRFNVYTRQPRRSGNKWKIIATFDDRKMAIGFAVDSLGTCTLTEYKVVKSKKMIAFIRNEIKMVMREYE